MRTTTTSSTRNSFGNLLRNVLSTLALTAAVQTTALKADDDLVVDGISRSIPGGTFRVIVVKNSGSLTVTNGTLVAQELYLVTNGMLTTSSNIQCSTLSLDGTLNCGGSLDCGTVIVVRGTNTVSGINNHVSQLTIMSTLVAHGIWNVANLRIASNAVLQIRSISSGLPQAGTLAIYCTDMLIEMNGVLNANGVGNDPRGQGLDWYRSATGGSHFGQGGRGYWNSSGDGVRAPYGSTFVYEVFMGGAAGSSWGINNGGGSVLIEAENSVNITGDITVNGLAAPSDIFGGGAGGGIVLRSPMVALTGMLSANGGNAGYYGGGGGGGTIKVFYGNLVNSLTGHTSASGGGAGGFLNTQNGGDGNIFQDYIPSASNLSPEAGAARSNGIVTFRFNLLDLSQTLDGHTDSITPTIELSSDGFNSVAYAFDQSNAFSGWSKITYYSGDIAEFTTQTPLSSNVYQWRVKVRDQSLYSRFTNPQDLIVGSEPPNSTLSADIGMTPTVVITGSLGSRCSIEYADNVGLGSVWHTVAIVTITNKPQLYFDTSGIGKLARFYRLEQVP